MRKIRWNRQAVSDYYDNIDYLLEKWTEKEAQGFIDEVYEIELLLSQGNIDFQETNIEGIKRCVIRRQVTLFYRVIDDGNLEFLRFWNNLLHPDSLKF